MTYSLLNIPCRDRWARGTRVRNVVIHVNVGPEVQGGAVSLAHFTQRQQGAYHEVVDNAVTVRTANDNERVAGAAGLNDAGYHICIIGYPDQSPQQWDDAYSHAAVDLAAQRAALAVRRFGLNIAFCDAQALLANRTGVTSHKQVSDAFHKSTHWDPGPNFPWPAFMAKVAHYAGAPQPAPMPPTPVTKPTLRIGSRGSFVTLMQHELNVGANQHLAEDGVFGAHTLDVVRGFQAFFKLTADGIVGPKTWGMVDYCFALKGGR